MRTWMRRRGVAGTVLLASGLVAGLLPVGAQAAGPAVVQGAKTSSPIAVGSKFESVAGLPVGAGTWLAYATWTVRIKTAFSVRPVVTCQLRAVQDGVVMDSHRTRTDRWISSFSGDAAMSSGMESIVGAELDATGTIRLVCRSDLGGVTAQRIRIVALKVPALDVATVSSSAALTVTSTTGPTLASDEGETLPDEQWKTVASLVLPEGRWWIHGVATLRDGTDDGAYITEEVDCRISLGGRESGAVLPTFLHGFRVHTWDLAAATTSVRGGKTARLRCDGVGTVLRLEDIRLVAWPLGKLTTWAAASETATTVGSGAPAAIHSVGATHPRVPGGLIGGPTHVIDVPVPAGNWLAKAVFTTNVDAGDLEPATTGKLTCTWGTGSGDESATIPLPWEKDRPSMMTTINSHTATVAKLVCTVPDGLRGTAGIIKDLRATLIAVGGITTVPLD